MSVKKLGTLEIDEEAFELNERFWKIRKIVLLILLIFLIAALLGFLGPGLLGTRIEKSTDGLFWIQYNKFIRREASTSFTIKINPSLLGTKSAIIPLQISQNYLSKFYIEQIIPTPLWVATNGKSLIYDFRVHTNQAFIVQFLVIPKNIGFVKGIFELNNRIIQLKQFVYP